MTTGNPYAGLGTNIANAFSGWLNGLLSANQRNYDKAIEVDRLLRKGITPESLQTGEYYGTWNPTPAVRAMATEDLAERAIDRANQQAYDVAMQNAIEPPVEAPAAPAIPMLDAAQLEAIAASLGLNKAPTKRASKPRTRKANSSGSNSGKIEVLQPDVLARQQEPGIREYRNEASDNYWRGREAELERVRRSLGLI